MPWIFVHLPQRISYWYRKAYLAVECTWHAWIQSWDLISICAREELYPDPSVSILSSSSRAMLGMTQKFPILKMALHKNCDFKNNHPYKIEKILHFSSFNQRESMCLFEQNDILSLPANSLGFFPFSIFIASTAILWFYYSNFSIKTKCCRIPF